MNHTYKVLKSDIELFAAALNQVRVYVVQPLSDDMVEIVDYGGVVEKITPDSIKVNGSYFMRDQFEFRVETQFIFEYSLSELGIYIQIKKCSTPATTE
ncbi:UNVERIFIED_CONTAM: hypothetical protein ABIC26_002313 [Paenibacillus sp. PvR008]